MRKQFSLLSKLTLRSRWLVVGMGIKHWLLVLAAGASLSGLGIFHLIRFVYDQEIIPRPLYDLLTFQFLPIWLRILAPIVLGVLVILVTVAKIGANLIEPFRRPDENIIESLYHYRQRGRGPRIVAIGGGTGLPTLLRGLTQFTSNITAIVTVADDGGSSGRLRRQLEMLPPGDFRNNIAALARDEALMTQLLQYRFGGSPTSKDRSELEGHAFGNLLLAALTGITGSFEEALLAAARVLAIRGQVLPSTLDNVTLAAEVRVANDPAGPPAVQRVVGESLIPMTAGQIQRISLEPSDVRAYPPAVQAIFKADLIAIGPGSLFTSILPNLLVPGLADALRHSKALKVYVCNLAVQPGETDNYTVADHVAALTRHVPPDCIDVVLANDKLNVDPDAGGGHTILVRPAALPPGMRLEQMDLVEEGRPWRHDSDKLARAMMRFLA